MVNRKLARMLDRPRLSKLAAETYSAARFGLLKARALTDRTTPACDDGGIPRPPDRLIYLISGGIDWPWFLESGRFHAEQIQKALENHGAPLEDCGAALDFGCGSGRIIRHLAPYANRVRLHGVDYNTTLVDWCQRNLRFATFGRNQPMPPLSFGTGSFGLVYAYSVFTHLTEEGHRRWCDELARIVRPGGHLWVTVHNERNNAKLTRDELSQLRDGGLVVRFAGAAGGNYCTAFPSDAYLARLFSADSGWTVLERMPAGPDWDQPIQDYLLLRRV